MKKKIKDNGKIDYFKIKSQQKVKKLIDYLTTSKQTAFFLFYFLFFISKDTSILLKKEGL